MIVEGLDLVGKHFGGYNILGELGRGGMAVVYKADESSLNRVVALKVISPKIAGDDTMIKRFQREAQIVAGLNHPNVIHIYGMGEENGMPYFAMEYVKGKTLDEYLISSGGASLAQVLSIVKQVARALGEAHQAGLVHRDIKPSNIMVQDTGLVKVMDFGIAHVVEAVTRLTVEGSFLGTPTFMSPEQCEGGGIDARSDLYSLGIVLYEILAGAPPFEAGTPASILVKIVKGDIAPLGEVRPDLPEELVAVVDKLIRTDREERYADADALLVDLEELAPLISGGVTDVHDFSQAFTGAINVASVETVIASPRKKAMAGGWVAALAGVVLGVGGVFWWQPWGGAEPEGGGSHEATLASKNELKISPLGEDAAPEERAAAPAPLEDGAGSVASREAGGEGGDAVVAWAEELDSPSSPVRVGAKGVEPRVVASATVPAGTGQSVSEATALPPPASVGSGRPVAEVPVVSTSEPKLMLEAKAAVFVPPPEDSVLVHARGDQGLAAVVTSEAGKAVGRFGLKRIRKVLKEGDVLPQVAAVELVVTTRELGSRELSFYGKRSVATTVSLTAELIQTAEGEVLAGPVTEQVEYTTLNRDANVREAVGRLMRKLQKDRDTE